MEQDITQTGTTTLNTSIPLYSVPHVKVDEAGNVIENYWYFNDWTEKLGYYDTIPEYKKAIDTYATWVLGKGLDADSLTEASLNNISGAGDDTFLGVLWNMLVVKKANGDSFAEVSRNEKTGTIINIKPLNPESVRLVYNPKGAIIRYDYRQAGNNGVWKPLAKNKMLHLCNDRIANQMHGTYAGKAAKWVIDARHELMEDMRRISHRSTIRVLYVDEEDKTRRANLKRDYATAIKKGELLILPGSNKDMGFQDLTMPPIQMFLEQIKYYENVFYQVVGVPKVISGGTQDTTESGAKVSYAAFEPNYTRETTDLEADLWNQLAIKITFKKPASMMEGMQEQEGKNQAQTGFQPNDVQAGVGK